MVPGPLIPPTTPTTASPLEKHRSINVNYQVADSGGLTDTNSFQITLNGTNDTPDATFLHRANGGRGWNGCYWSAHSLIPINADDAMATNLSYKLIGAPIDGLSIRLMDLGSSIQRMRRIRR